MLLCLAIWYDCNIAVTGVKNFFLQAKLPADNCKVYYVHIIDGWENHAPGTHAAKVMAPWYGNQLAATLQKAGLKENPWFPNVFSNCMVEGKFRMLCYTHRGRSLDM